MEFNEYVHYTIYQLAKFLDVTPDEFFDFLVENSYASIQDDRYCILDAGADLGGVYSAFECDKYNVMFPGAILENQGIKDSLVDLIQRKENLLEQKHAINQSN